MAYDREHTTKKEITFYSHTEPVYGCFSNFSHHPIQLKNRVWPTVEHYFQAQKYEGTAREEIIRTARDPNTAARIGRNRSEPLRPDWEQIKNEVMRIAVYTKFTQHKDLKNILLSTGDATLIEHTNRDSYWGDGGDGSGQNWLGKTLMIVREQILTEMAQKQPQEPTNPAYTEVSKPMRPETKEKSSGSEESEESESDEDETSQTGELRIVSTPFHGNPKRKESKRRKARRKRGVFVDGDGSATIEKNNEEKGTVNVVGTSQPVTFSEKALPTSAKFVIHRNQFKKKRQAKEEDFESSEDEENISESRVNNTKPSFADYLPASAQNDDEEKEVEEDTPDYLLSPVACIEAVKNTIELLNQLPKNDPEVPQLMHRCKQFQSVMTEFIAQVEQEDLMAELLTQFENLNRVTLVQ